MKRSAAIPLAGLAALTTIGFAPVGTAPGLEDCANDICTMRMTAPELLRMAEQLVLKRRFEEATPLLEALANAPEYSMQRHFLLGYVAAETGKLPQAEREFRAVLRERPDVTRARLELARVLLLQGKDDAADHHLRLAENARDIPPEIERTIREQRGVIRSRRNWYFNFDFGLAPDSNVNGATTASTIDTTLLGLDGKPIQLELDDAARRKSGVGQTFGVQAGVRLRLSDGLAMVIDANGDVVNQPGKSADDVSALLAAGPELTMTSGTRVGIQAVGVGRWYGGTRAQTGGGVRLSVQKDLQGAQRVGAQVDIRHIDSGYSDAYSGWQMAGYASYDKIVGKTMIASATAFVRREDLQSSAYSSTEFGYNIGIGGELRGGINAGAAVGISRALFDSPLALLSTEPRKDWRVNARAYAGLRSIRLLGFSPAITYTYSRNRSNLDFYDTTRHRVQFELAKYF